jgi:hypothetical protein
MSEIDVDSVSGLRLLWICVVQVARLRSSEISAPKRLFENSKRPIRSCSHWSTYAIFCRFGEVGAKDCAEVCCSEIIKPSLSS